PAGGAPPCRDDPLGLAKPLDGPDVVEALAHLERREEASPCEVGEHLAEVEDLTVLEGGERRPAEGDHAVGEVFVRPGAGTLLVPGDSPTAPVDVARLPTVPVPENGHQAEASAPRERSLGRSDVEREERVAIRHPECVWEGGKRRGDRATGAEQAFPVGT